MKRLAKRPDEHDVVYCRAVYCWTQRPGATSSVKRRMRRRERQEGKAQARGQW